MWLQKARINWQQNGDRNTKYFHNVVKYKWSKNKIKGVKSRGDVWVKNPEQIKLEFFEYFMDFFKEKHKRYFYAGHSNGQRVGGVRI